MTEKEEFLTKLETVFSEYHAKIGSDNSKKPKPTKQPKISKKEIISRMINQRDEYVNIFNKIINEQMVKKQIIDTTSGNTITVENCKFNLSTNSLDIIVQSNNKVIEVDVIIPNK